MLVSIHFKNFKALNDFTIHLKDCNILTGPNNNGKSTILDGIRVLQGAYRYAARYNPELFLDLPFNIPDSWGYKIPPTSIPIILENLQTNFNTNEPSLIKYKFSQGQTLTLCFHPEQPIYLLLETPRKLPRNRKEFTDDFPLNISIIPTLGPFEIEEQTVEPEYIKRWYGSRRSPRLFRNYWFYFRENFNEFKNLVERTWPGASISAPERKTDFSKELMMFCSEDRMLREIC